MGKNKKDCNRWFGHSRCCKKREQNKCPIEIKSIGAYPLTRCQDKFITKPKILSSFIYYGDL